ncbi:MAG: glycosyltransferase family 2 protein [Chloroflexi bacterium]|nr:glycosyltransferase family 2 protein [Chloroflexota bacterium]
MADLAVIIVNWNTRQLTLDALRTLYDDIQENGPAATEIWVVDNASSDNSAAAIKADFPQVNLIESATNLGFAAANNLAMREMGFQNGKPVGELPRAVYLLNSDTLTHSGATNILYQTLLSRPEAGVVGARLTYGDGRFQHSAFAFPGLIQLWIDLLPAPGRLYESRLNGRYPQRYYRGLAPFPVGHTLGATMMPRREVIQQVGMFDERFFMYAEEVDWCWMIQKAGWKILCVPAAHVTHLEGQSTRQVKPHSIVNLWKSRLRLYEKHYSRPKRWLARLLVRLGMRWQIRQTLQAYAQRRISAKERDALIEAYRQVMAL